MYAVWIMVIICFSCLQARGQGGPPMITDDPGTVEKGHFEINSGIGAELTTSESQYEFPFIDINYGISVRQHINFEIPLVSNYVKGIEPQMGIGKLGIGTKLRFVDQDSAGIDISTHPAAYFVLSNNAVDKGVIDEGTELFIPVEFQRAFNNNIVGLEIGRLINSKNPGVWTYGLLYAMEFNSRVNAAAELNGNISPAFNETELFLNLGARMTMTKCLTILFSCGRSLVSTESMKNIYTGYLALQIAF